MRYLDLSPEQKQALCNGCGGKGGWIKPPYADFFKEQCNWHDFNYFLGFTEKHRAKADNQLRLAMQAKIMELPLWKRIIMRPWCNTYYLAVRISGSKYFYYGDKEQEVTIMKEI